MTHPLDAIGHFRTARLLSYTSDADRPGKRLGAVLHHGRRPLSYGVNSLVRTHPVQDRSPHKIYIHAEVAALIGRRHYGDLARCSVTVYREVDGQPAMAMPCPQCQAILSTAGIRRVYYSIPEPPYYGLMRL